MYRIAPLVDPPLNRAFLFLPSEKDKGISKEKSSMTSHGYTVSNRDNTTCLTYPSIHPFTDERSHAVLIILRIIKTN